MSPTSHIVRGGRRARARVREGCGFAVVIGGLCGVAGYGGAPVLGQCTETQKLSASDAAADASFGGSVAVEGDTAVVGAHRVDCASGTECGAAYVFRFNGTMWIEEEKLTASDAAGGDWFGVSVAVDGGAVVVGASRDRCPGGDIGCGAVYVFQFDGTDWVEEQKLTASDSALGDTFGVSVGIDGNTVVVGAFADDCTTGSDCGSAYVFRFDGTEWIETHKLAGSDTAAHDWFGRSVAVDGDVIFASARYHDCTAGDDCGAAYVFRLDGADWVQEQTLTASDAAAEATFGEPLAFDGDTAAIVAPAVRCDPKTTFWCETVYFFRFDSSNWVEVDRVRGQSLSFDSVAVDHGTFIGGNTNADCGAGSFCGSANVYRSDGGGWTREQTLSAPDAEAGDSFGSAVALDGATVLVGTALDDCTAGSDCGSAYVLDCPAFAGPAIPALSTWGLVGLTLLLVTAGTVVLHRTIRSRGSGTFADAMGR